MTSLEIRREKRRRKWERQRLARRKRMWLAMTDEEREKERGEERAKWREMSMEWREKWHAREKWRVRVEEDQEYARLRSMTEEEREREADVWRAKWREMKEGERERYRDEMIWRGITEDVKIEILRLLGQKTKNLPRTTKMRFDISDTDISATNPHDLTSTATP